jgi:hypothetical protein
MFRTEAINVRAVAGIVFGTCRTSTGPTWKVPGDSARPKRPAEESERKSVCPSLEALSANLRARVARFQGKSERTRTRFPAVAVSPMTASSP